MTASQPHLLIASDTAPKTGAHSEGAIEYRLMTDEARSDVFIAITDNIGGTGYFSKEAVPFSKIMHCIANLPSSAPLPSRTFMQAFQGRSTNNGAFMAAILRHLGLLVPAIDVAHQHLQAGDWERWRQERLSDHAQPLPASEPLTADEPSQTDQPKVSQGNSLNRAKGKKLQARESKQQPAITATDESQDADLA